MKISLVIVQNENKQKVSFDKIPIGIALILAYAFISSDCIFEARCNWHA